MSRIVASQHNDSIRVEGLLLSSPTVGEGLGMRAIELRLREGMAIAAGLAIRNFAGVRSKVMLRGMPIRISSHSASHV